MRDTLTHEVGHFLGLGHSHADGALMSAGYNMVQLSRELFTEDDIAAICAAYPPGAPLACTVPNAPAYDECQIEPGTKQEECIIESTTHKEKSGDCSFAASRSRTLWQLPGAVLLLGLLRRRRYSRKQRHDVSRRGESDSEQAAWIGHLVKASSSAHAGAVGGGRSKRMPHFSGALLRHF